ncbi:M14 family zinc carboxypeptidase [Ilumatobacter fluminis]|uniref:M14 family zinc carboxypeptidase n=1 Tax=Ilumatobacter fluminis TaxID=467091 RepID=UPI0032EC0B1C
MAVLVASLLVASCSSATDESDEGATTTSTALPSSSSSSTSTSTTPVSTSTTSTVPPTTSSTTTTSTTTTSTTSSTTTSTTTTSTSTTTSTTTLPPVTLPPIPGIPPIVPIDPATVPFETEFEIGRSVNGVPITVVRRGDPSGTRVLAVGVIHGNEADGVAIVDRLRTDPVPPGVELWLVRSMNPDGEAIGDRQNANLVDLNRNFPENWDVLGEPGFWQYGGVGPASEPETQAMVALGSGVRPDIVLWYHQDLFRLAPGTGRAGDIRLRYAEIAGLPIVDISGGTYTGTASQWARTVIPEGGVGITVELGPTLSAEEVDRHVAAVAAIATEFF